MKKVLLLMFHPRLETSKVNNPIWQHLRQLPFIHAKDMYDLYPDFNIDVKREQRDLLEADLIVFQHPFFWYSAPPLTKQWIDLVLEFGWAYGVGGDKLKGKAVLHIISSGGGFDAYHAKGKNRYTYNELLRPFELTYRLCQMTLLPPYIVPGANRLTSGEIESHCGRIQQHLERLALNASPAEYASITYLNDYM